MTALSRSRWAPVRPRRESLPASCRRALGSCLNSALGDLTGIFAGLCGRVLLKAAVALLRALAMMQAERFGDLSPGDPEIAGVVDGYALAFVEGGALSSDGLEFRELSSDMAIGIVLVRPHRNLPAVILLPNFVNVLLANESFKDNVLSSFLITFWPFWAFWQVP